MIQALSDLAAGKIQIGAKKSQQARKGKKPYTFKQIAAIADNINKGKIQLPDITLDSNEEWEALWALVDAGSSVDVADMERDFPGAKVKEPQAGEKDFAAANGSKVRNLGSATIRAKTVEGDDITSDWKNAKVAMPIISTNKRTQGGKAVLYHETGGSLINPHNSIQSGFVESGGVYFIKLLVPKALVKHKPDQGEAAQGFAGQGAVSD